MDEKPFEPLLNNRDILFVSDSSELNFNLANNCDFDKYEKLILIAFSAGVFMASYLQDILPIFDLKIAVNGTLNMLDEQQGVPQAIFTEMENLTVENALEFREKITDNETDLDLFNKYQPSSSLESSINELKMFKKNFSTPKNFDFNKIIIGKNDIIFPTKNQLRAWDNHKTICETTGGYFPFYEISSLDEIINFDCIIETITGRIL